MNAKDARKITERSLKSDKLVYDRIKNSIKYAAEKAKSSIELKEILSDTVVEKLRKEGYDVEYLYLFNATIIQW